MVFGHQTMNRYSFTEKVDPRPNKVFLIEGSAWRLNRKGKKHYKRKHKNNPKWMERFEVIEGIVKHEGSWISQYGIKQQGVGWGHCWGMFPEDVFLRYYEPVSVQR